MLAIVSRSEGWTTNGKLLSGVGKRDMNYDFMRSNREVCLTIMTCEPADYGKAIEARALQAISEDTLNLVTCTQTVVNSRFV